jgi:gamma-glutamylcyclotransferase (GGCT)/AIG2-like uncharacterized protein YtfP
MKSTFLFVYGTLRRNTQNKMANLLVRRAEFVGSALYQGKLYKADNYPGVVPSGKLTDWVPGEVYRLRYPSLLLAHLDGYEECGLNFSGPTEYVCKIQRVRLQGGKLICAWIYLYNWPTYKHERMRSSSFLNLYPRGSKRISGW